MRGASAKQLCREWLDTPAVPEARWRIQMASPLPPAPNVAIARAIAPGVLHGAKGGLRGSKREARGSKRGLRGLVLVPFQQLLLLFGRNVRGNTLTWQAKGGPGAEGGARGGNVSKNGIV